MEEINNNIKLKDACAEIFKKANKIRERIKLKTGVAECSELESLAFDMHYIEMYIEEVLKKELDDLRETLETREKLETKLDDYLMTLQKENKQLREVIINMSIIFFNNNKK